MKKQKTKVNKLQKQVKNLKKELADSLARESLVLKLTKGKPLNGSGIKGVADLHSFQAEFLRGVSNRIRLGNQSNIGFALCECQPGVKPHPLLWFPNETVVDLLDKLVFNSNNKEFVFALYRNMED